MFANTRQSVAADNIIVRLYKLITSATGQWSVAAAAVNRLPAEVVNLSVNYYCREVRPRSNLPPKQRTNWLPLLLQQHLCTAIRVAQLLTKRTAYVLQ